MLTLPEIRVIERTSQSGTAKIGLVAYDAKTRQVLGQGGTSLSLSTDNKWSVGGIGPFREGSIKHEFARSNQGAAASRPNRLPAHVVFESPARGPLDGQDVQFANGERPAGP
jgi:hypothetical protein